MKTQQQDSINCSINDQSTLVVGEENGGEKIESSSLSFKELDNVPARRFLHKVFILISILTSLCAIWMIIGQILGFIVYENGPTNYVLRSYLIVFCMLVILVELEWPRLARETVLLHNWISRGLIYVFIGVLGLQENDAIVKEGSEQYATMLEICKAVAWNMIGCGILYFVMGVFCLQLVLNRMRKSYQARLVCAKQHNSGKIVNGKGSKMNVGMDEGFELSLSDEEDSMDVEASVDKDALKEQGTDDIDSSGTETDVEAARHETVVTESAATEPST